jgi:uncharacterized protein YacL
MEGPDQKHRLSEVNEELRELERSINATRTHGIFYYALLVFIIFLAIALGYATSTLAGIAIAVAGLAVVAYREVNLYRERTTAIGTLIAEKRHEKHSLEERMKGI